MTFTDACQSPRANVEIMPGAGMAEGRKGFVRGVSYAFGTVHVGLTDEAGNYTGEAIPVTPEFVRFTGGSHTYP